MAWERNGGAGARLQEDMNAHVGHMVRRRRTRREEDDEGNRPTQNVGGQSLTERATAPIGYGRCGGGRAKTAGRGRSRADERRHPCK